MHPLYRYITDNNNVIWKDYLPLVLGEKHLGRVHHVVARILCDAGLITETNQTLFLKNERPDADGRTAQLRTILHHLIEKKIIAKERFEAYSVATSFKDSPVALVDRALIPALGFVAYGVHCNGFVKKGSRFQLWIGKRSSDRATDPGKYDHMIAGGQPHGLTVFENLAKEAHEEAGVTPIMLERAKSVGTVSYARALPNGIRRDVLFLFDLRCPDGFTPTNQDGEVESFQLMPTQDVLQMLHTRNDFKFNVNLVLIDFFIRHNIIKCDEAWYHELCSGLRSPLQ